MRYVQTSSDYIFDAKTDLGVNETLKEFDNAFIDKTSGALKLVVPRGTFTTGGQLVVRVGNVEMSDHTADKSMRTFSDFEKKKFTYIHYDLP